MTLILPQAQAKQSFSSRLGSGIGQGISQGLSRGMDQGINFSEKMNLQKQEAEQKFKNLMLKNETDKPDYSNAIRSIGDMREIIKRGNTGYNFFNKLTPSGRGDRAALDTSALNLEKLAADMVGKGTLSKERFDFLKQRLPSSDKSDAENESILNEWEKILGGSSNIEVENKTDNKQSKERPPLSSFHR